MAELYLYPNPGSTASSNLYTVHGCIILLGLHYRLQRSREPADHLTDLSQQCQPRNSYEASTESTHQAIHTNKQLPTLFKT
ncbi:hypothetical protein Q3G72_030613 [Acer saccharum]|nr:hypothetical protein Q3G72_030613 [Acer saccharum]